MLEQFIAAQPGNRTRGIASALRTGLFAVLCGYLAATVLTGCSLLTSTETRIEPPPVKAPVTKTPAPIITRVAIAYADDVPVYRSIAGQLQARIKAKVELVPLHDEGQTTGFFSDATKVSGFDQIIVIGDRAARGASKLSRPPIIFCQVFNYADYLSAAKNIQGVSMVPPAKQQFKAWKAVAPDLRRVGVITGPGHEQLIAQARTMGQKQDIELIHRVVQTDKEMLYEFKRLVPDIDGIWLLPDDRILSHRVLRELMAYSNKHNKQILAFHPELLRLGGLISANSIESDVVEQVLAAMKSAAKAGAKSKFRLRPLTRAHIEINSNLARQMGYSVTLPSAQGKPDAR